MANLHPKQRPRRARPRCERVACDRGEASALALATVALAWKVEVGGDLPAFSAGVIYAGSSNGNLKALQGSSGSTTLWTYAAGSAIRTTPSVNLGGTPASGPRAIYVGTDNGMVTAVSSGGFKKWSVPFASAVAGISSTNGDAVIVELANGVVGATRGPNDGFNFWKYQTGGSLDTTPAIVFGAVYVSAGDGGLYAFTPFGQAPLLRSDAAGARARLRALRPATHWSVAPGGTVAARAAVRPPLPI